MLYSVIVLVISVCFLLKLIFSVHRRRGQFKNIPTPRTTFLLGNALEFRKPTEILKVLQRYFNQYGKTIHIEVGPVRDGVITTDYRLVEIIFNSTKILRKSENYQFLTSWLGTGLLISDGNLWKKHRKLITPAFHFEILKQFVRTFESAGDIFVDKLNSHGDEKSLDIYPLVSLCTMDIISETAMGTQINAQIDENSKYVKSVKEMTKIIINRSVNPMKIHPATYSWTRDYSVEKKALTIIHDYSLQLIKENSKKQKRNLNNGDQMFTGVRNKMAFLDLLMKYNNEQRSLSLDEVKDEVNTFMFEGHDTTASAISFSLFCLANHREVQERTVKEQKQLFGEDKNPEVTYQNLQDMKYLEKVIKETLRLYPSVPIIGRYTTEDIEFDGYKIPGETNVGICIFEIHRNPQVFPQPEKFQPERFDSSEIPPFAYVPFSAGPRNCIGQRFAMLEMKSVISKILRNFELAPASPKHDLVLSAETVLVSANGIKVGLKRRL